MIFWPHNNIFDKPPELEDLRYRRPKTKHYWEAIAGNKQAALPGFWNRWKKETGKEFPRPRPITPKNVYSRVITTRVQQSRRPDHHQEKNVQDNREL